MIFRLLLLITISLITNFSIVQASDHLDVAKVNQSSISLTSYFGIFEDKSQAFTIDDVQKTSSQFKTDLPVSKSLNLSYSTKRLTLAKQL